MAWFLLNEFNAMSVTAINVHPPSDLAHVEHDPVAEATAGARLVIATNREPFTLRTSQGATKLKRTPGGVVSALLPVVEKSGGRWIAWHTGAAAQREELERRLPYLRLVNVTPAEVRAYYQGFANGALWPLCHYTIDRCSFEPHEWDVYVAVNRRFAERIAVEASSEDVVWVHDYQLCLVPQFLRNNGAALRSIAYFHHIPFPGPEVFRVLPWYEETLRGLLGADQVGFHTEGYVKNFLLTCELLAGVEVDHAAQTVSFDGRSVRVRAFPIGVDVPGLDRLAKQPSVQKEARTIRTGLRVEKLLLSVDRLDYTKGIAERFKAIDEFFMAHPQLRGCVSLLQIAVPSRAEVTEYRRLKKEVDELIGRVNGKHAQNGWQPIHCTYRSYSLKSLVAHYQAADVALVTPVRDGMNLVAKEFCASRIDEDGVLVLSEFAGAAECLGSAALLVNPFHVVQYTQAIEHALGMNRDERRRRMQRMRNIVARYDVGEWVQRVIADATRDCAAAAR